MGEKGVGKLSQETPPPREGEPMGVGSCCLSVAERCSYQHYTCECKSGTDGELRERG